jgi:hypothetical protein
VWLNRLHSGQFSTGYASGARSKTQQAKSGRKKKRRPIQIGAAIITHQLTTQPTLPFQPKCLQNSNVHATAMPRWRIPFASFRTHKKATVSSVFCAFLITTFFTPERAAAKAKVPDRGSRVNFTLHA